MKKYAASIPAILLAVLTPFTPAIQAWMSEHVAVMTLLGMLNVILAHLLPSPVAQQGADEPPKAPKLPMFCLCLALLAVGCTGAQKAVARDVLDIGSAVCAEVGPQTSSSYVDLVCSVIDVADGTSHVFLARVRRIDAQALAAKSCPGAQ